jgi:two-component system chemotaxis response regulator CheV
MGAPDTPLLNMVNNRTRLAGSNRMELLLFSLGGPENFGINVFKVREVCEAMTITRAPNMPHGVEGIVSLRGSILPVIHLAKCLGIGDEKAGAKLIITEFSARTQAFLVADVDRIVRVDWEQVRSPQSMLAGSATRVTAITELEGGKLVSILDVEQILADVMGEDVVTRLDAVPAAKTNHVFFADDSALARKKIAEVLDQMGLAHQSATNGREAWEKLQAIASRCADSGRAITQELGLILVDAEMPEMDGYVLTRHIKGDARFDGLSVVMHSSLSSVANRKLGQQVGVDAYVAKFHPDELSREITGRLVAKAG